MIDTTQHPLLKIDKKVLRIDASALKKSSCMLAFKRIVSDGYRSAAHFNDVLYGSSFHLFVAEMYRTRGDFSKAIAGAVQLYKKPTIIRKKHLTEQHLIKTCLDYWEHFRATDNFEVLEVDGEPMVEVTFEINIYEDDEYIIHLVGTIDKIGQFVKGCYAIGDYKTTGSWSSDDYFKKYRISTQLITYFYALRKLAEFNPNSPLAKICNTKVGVFIDGIFVTAAKTEFKRSEVMFLDDKLDEYETLLQRKCIQLVAAINEEPIREGIIQGSCVDMEYKCDFYNVCSAPDKIASSYMLKRDFIQKEYNPFKFNE